jgi:hypothetical protein
MDLRIRTTRRIGLDGVPSFRSAWTAEGGCPHIVCSLARS